MKINFKIDGEPKGKARPRIYGNRMYKTKEVCEIEDHIRDSFRSNNTQDVYFGANIPLEVKIRSFFEKPKNLTRVLKEKYACGKIFPTKKPDADNISKLVLDALNKVAFYDDKQVIRLNIEKIYDEVPHMEVEICEAK